MKKILVLLCVTTSLLQGMEPNSHIPEGCKTMFDTPPAAYQDNQSVALLQTLAGTKCFYEQRASEIRQDGMLHNLGDLAFAGQQGEMFVAEKKYAYLFNRYSLETEYNRFMSLADSVAEKERLLIHAQEITGGKAESIAQCERMRVNDLYLLAHVVKSKGTVLGGSDIINSLKEILVKTHVVWPPREVAGQVHKNSGYLELLLALQWRKEQGIDKNDFRESWMMTKDTEGRTIITVTQSSSSARPTNPADNNNNS